MQTAEGRFLVRLCEGDVGKRQLGSSGQAGACVFERGSKGNQARCCFVLAIAILKTGFRNNRRLAWFASTPPCESGAFRKLGLLVKGHQGCY